MDLRRGSCQSASQLQTRGAIGRDAPVGAVFRSSAVKDADFRLAGEQPATRSEYACRAAALPRDPVQLRAMAGIEEPCTLSEPVLLE